MDSYTLLNEYNFSSYSESGEFTDRFYITFMDTNESSSMALSIEENELETLKVYFNKHSQ